MMLAVPGGPPSGANAGGRPATGSAVEAAARTGTDPPIEESPNRAPGGILRAPTPARDNEEDDMADDVSTGLRQVVEKVLEADVTDQIARRGRELAASVAEATDVVSERAGEIWRDSAPQRREAEKNVRRASGEAMKWSEQTWRRQVRPTLKDLWSRRRAAVGATAAAIPVGREMVEDAAVRLGISKRRERSHWVAFFVGLLLGVAAGAVAAMLTTPKPGREMRDELADRARDAADKAREGAGDWVPLFQRHEDAEGVNGQVDEMGEAPVTPAEGEEAH
jgi:hypothetical protein